MCQVIAGRAGSGRSRALFDKLKELSRASSDVKLLYIVPEQFTFETERTLASELDSGLLNVSVLSFTSLARRVLSETGERRVFLSEQGRRMSIRHALVDAQAKAQLRFFGRVASRVGFSGECDKLFTMLKRAGITPQMLMSAHDALDDSSTLLKNKLYDIALIYANVNAALDGYIDGEDAFKVLSFNLHRSSYASAHVFIDGFDLISARLYDVIGAILDVSLSVTIALRLDTGETCRDSEVFSAERRLLSRIERIAHEHGKPIELTALTGSSKKYKNTVLTFLEREAFAYPCSKYEGDFPAENAITLTAAHEPVNEAEAVAEDIARLIREGKRYRDIAIIATDMNAYMNVVSRALTSRGIPFFTDAKHPLSSYSAPRLIIDALYCAARGFSTDSILSLIKTGLTGLSRDEAEKLENYALKRGLRSLAYEVQDDDEAELLENARLTLMEPLLKLRSRLSGSATVRGKVEALYDYTVELKVRDKLVARADELKNAGRLELMEEISQIYEMTMELFSQLHAIMGDESMPNLLFAKTVEEGFDAYEVGVIPTGADQVLFGSIGRTKAKAVDVVFILGASEGAFPTSVGDDTFINGSEVKILSSYGLDEWQSASELNAKELSDAYGAVTKPREKLFISYSTGSDAKAPCELYLRLKDMFSLTERNDITFRRAQTTEEGFLQLTRALRAYQDTGRLGIGGIPDEGETMALLSYFSQSGEYARRFALIKDALNAKSSPAPLSDALTRRLYRADNALSLGVTQLETYNTCPFKHFARYALKAQPRKEYRERRVDEGIFAHEAMRRFSDKLIELGSGVAALTEENCSDILDALLPDLIATHNGGILNDSARMRATQRRLVLLIKTAAWAVVRQLQNGSFKLTATEASFGRGGEYPPIELELPDKRKLIISGVIDRVDEASGSQGKLIRVVDYKTGGTYFDYTELFYGLKIQLPLYLEAALTAYKAAKASGMYYLPVKTPSIAFDDNIELFERNLYRHFKLNGLTLNSLDITLNADKDNLKDTLTASPNYLVSDSELDFARRQALKRAKQAAQGALSGCADVSPYKHAVYTACKYCDYKDLCRFDESLEDCAFRQLRHLERNDFFASEAQNGVDS